MRCGQPQLSSRLACPEPGTAANATTSFVVLPTRPGAQPWPKSNHRHRGATPHMAAQQRADIFLTDQSSSRPHRQHSASCECSQCRRHHEERIERHRRGRGHPEVDARVGHGDGMAVAGHHRLPRRRATKSKWKTNGAQTSGRWRALRQNTGRERLSSGRRRPPVFHAHLLGEGK